MRLRFKITTMTITNGWVSIFLSSIGTNKSPYTRYDTMFKCHIWLKMVWNNLPQCGLEITAKITKIILHVVLLRLVCYSSAWPSNGSVFLKIHTSIWIGQIGWTRSNCHSLLSIFISFSLLFNIRIWLNKHNDRVRLHILIRLNVLGFVIVSFSFYLSAYLSVLFASSLLFFFFLLRSNNNNHVQIVCSRYIRFLSLF